jgi:hypothetical protein
LQRKVPDRLFVLHFAQTLQPSNGVLFARYISRLIAHKS